MSNKIADQVKTLIDLRIEKKLSQQGLGDLSGLTNKYIWKIEKGS
jgi:transcriptional regulator with XRE-family HTH domain